MINLKNKKILITGATGGIGNSLVKKFTSLESTVLATGTNESKSQRIKKDFPEIIIEKFDLANHNKIEEFIDKADKKLDGIDILVNNAGITRDTLLPRMSDEEFDAVIDTNLRGAFLFMRAVSKHMMSARYGRIINMSSVSGIQGNAGQTNYSASKAGLIGMTRSFSREISRRNVTVNCVAPGFIVTEMTAVLSEDILKKAKAGIPARKLGQVADVAACVTFLASGAASYVTGQTLTVDGGMTG